MSDTEKIEAILQKIKDKDPEDYEHSLRIQKIVDKILEKYDLPAEQKHIISEAALLHDVGIIEISEDIVFKPSRLSFDEYEEVKHHVELADKVISDLDIYKDIKDIIHHHHENMNGFGYPDGLEGDEIPLGARIIHVAEAFDSMTTNRKNRKYVSNKEQALAEIKEYQGRIYDPQIVEKLALVMEVI